ncbi:MAG: mftR 5 [Ilumatobacteraceae bacterium]|nr:mftR 5 [Ilumatobacteraceae bacterium]
MNAPPTPDGMRAQRRAFTVTEIARRAIDLFVERGYDDVTVDEIAVAAGISARTFFRYFPSKSDVLREHQRHLFDRLTRALTARPASESPSTALRKAFLFTAEMRAEDNDRYVAVGRLLFRDDTALADAFAFESARVDELIRALVGRGARHDIDLEATVGAHLGAAQAAFRFWVRHGGREPLIDLMQRAFGHVKSGRTS